MDRRLSVTVGGIGKEVCSFGHIPPFHALPDWTKLQLKSICDFRTLKKEDVLVYEGDQSESVFFVANGLLRMQKTL